MIILTALAANTLLGVAAYLRRSVSESGLFAGIFLGTGLWIFGGISSWTVMVLFFISSTILTKLLKKSLAGFDRVHAKSGRRDAVQVFANGGPALAIALLSALYHAPDLLILISVSFAASTADTWAGDIGSSYPGDPVSLLRRIKVPRGLSGGVTLRGLVASIAGAAFIGILTPVVFFDLPAGRPALVTALAVSLAGFIGSVTDSILGDSVQALYLLPDGSWTERVIEDARLIRGVSWMTNDLVNLISNAAAILTGALLLA